MTTPKLISILPLALVLATGLAAGPLRAQTRDPALAETLFREGKRLMQAKKYTEACPKFEASYNAEPAPGTLLNAAACLEGAGKLASAWVRFSDALALARRDGAQDKVKYAEERLRAIEPQLVRVQIQVAPDTAAISGLEVRVGERLIPAAAYGVPVPVDGGTHVIEARAPGRKAVRYAIRADIPGTTIAAPIGALAPETAPSDAPAVASKAPASPEPAATLPPQTAPPALAPEAPPPQKSSPPPADPRNDEAAPSGGSKAPAVFALGVGVVGLGAGVVLYALAGSENDEALAGCPKDDTGARLCTTDTERKEVEDHRSTAGLLLTASYVSAGLGAAALITGAVLFATAGPAASSASAAKPRVSPIIDPRRGFAGLEMNAQW